MTTVPSSFKTISAPPAENSRTSPGKSVPASFTTPRHTPPVITASVPCGTLTAMPYGTVTVGARRSSSVQTEISPPPVVTTPVFTLSAFSAVSFFVSHMFMPPLNRFKMQLGLHVFPTQQNVFGDEPHLAKLLRPHRVPHVSVYIRSTRQL